MVRVGQRESGQMWLLTVYNQYSVMNFENNFLQPKVIKVRVSRNNSTFEIFLDKVTNILLINVFRGRVIWTIIFKFRYFAIKSYEQYKLTIVFIFGTSPCAPFFSLRDAEPVEFQIMILNNKQTITIILFCDKLEYGSCYQYCHSIMKNDVIHKALKIICNKPSNYNELRPY